MGKNGQYPCFSGCLDQRTHRLFSPLILHINELCQTERHQVFIQRHVIRGRDGLLTAFLFRAEGKQNGPLAQHLPKGRQKLRCRERSLQPVQPPLHQICRKGTDLSCLCQHLFLIFRHDRYADLRDAVPQHHISCLHTLPSAHTSFVSPLSPISAFRFSLDQCITNITDTCILQITLLFTVHSITKDSLLCHGNLRLRSNILQSREGLPCTSRTALPRV